MSNLSLVPIEQLVHELKSRTTNCIIAYTYLDSNGPEGLHVEVKAETNWLTCAGMLVEIQDYINCHKPQPKYDEPYQDGEGVT